MEQTTTDGSKQRGGFLTTLCILSYIGSGLWALFSLLGIFASGVLMSMLGLGDTAMMDQAMEQAMEQAASMEGADPAAVQMASDIASAGGGMMSMIASYMVWICVVSLIFAILSLFGAIKMWGQKKTGFWIYSGVNGLTAIGMLISGSWFMGLVAVAFIVMYALNLKHMN